MSDELGPVGDRAPAPRADPPIRAHSPSRALLGRALAAGAAGALVTASTLLGAGTASAAGSAVIEKCTGETSSTEFGQDILASTSSLDSKVEQAVLVVFPLRFDLAKQAREQFNATGSVAVGTVTEQTQTFSGTTLADEFAPQIESLPALQDRGSDVSAQVRNLAALGCIGGAEVPGQPKPAPPPPEPEPTTEQPAPPPPPPAEFTSEETSEPVAVDATAAGAYPGYGASAPVVVVPPSYGSAAPGSLPPWAQSQFGQVPGFTPNVGDLRAQAAAKQREQAVQEEVRAAGKAEALPMGENNRVALPVLIAAVSLAGVTAALVRTWVLRRV